MESDQGQHQIFLSHSSQYLSNTHYLCFHSACPTPYPTQSQNEADSRLLLTEKMCSLSLCLVWFCDGGAHDTKQETTETITSKTSGLMSSPDQRVKKDRWKALSEGEKAKHGAGPLTALMDLHTKTCKSICWFHLFHGFVTLYKASQIDKKYFSKL